MGLRKNKKGSKGVIIVDALIMVILIVVLIPVIVTFSAGSQLCLEDATPYKQTGYDICSNNTDGNAGADDTNVSSTNSLSTTERLMLSLIALFIVLAFVFMLVKSTGLIKKK